MTQQHKHSKLFMMGLGVLMVMAFTIHGLINGSAWLTWQLFGQVPLGNLAVALCLTSVTSFNWLCLAESPFNQVVARLGLIVALLWYPVGIIWSGNLRLQFLNNGDLWLPFSYAVAVVCVVPLVVNSLIRVFTRPAQ